MVKCVRQNFFRFLFVWLVYVEKMKGKKEGKGDEKEKRDMEVGSK